jgi:2-amino-4-hydroxy-6-hydroxymethyldihydropteridine diphosphokinase
MNRSPDPATAFIAVGSNIEPEKYIPQALHCLKQLVTVTASSTFYCTKALGRPDQPDFINGLWQVQTTHLPYHIKHHILHNIENRLGRTRTTDKYAPRTIDLDLILYNDLQIHTPDLVLPHPDVERPFVYVPLYELLYATKSSMIIKKMQSFLPRDIDTTPPGEVLKALTRSLQDIVHLRS